MCIPDIISIHDPRVASAWREQARRVIEAGLAEFGFEAEPCGQDADLTDLRKSYPLPRSQLWLAVVGGDVVGTVGMRELDARTAELSRMYVRADQRPVRWRP